jgi:DNA mismatch repair ATPase MutS
MFRNSDFDPNQIFIQREKKPRSWETDERLSLEQFLPWNAKALIQDFALDILLNAMAGGDNFLFEVAKVSLLSSITEIDTILYRQNILLDCMMNETIIREIYQLSIETIEKEKENFGWGFFNRSPSSILHQALGKLEMFAEMLRKLRNIAELSRKNFNSEGFKRFFDMLLRELDDEYLANIDEHLKQLKFNDGILISAQLGKGNKGTNYILNRPFEDERNGLEKLLSKKLPGYSYQVSSRDEVGIRALAELRNQGINIVANALAQSTDHILSFFQALRTELAFYIGCLNLRQHLTELNNPTCFPVPFQLNERRMLFTGLYDVCLALKLKSDKPMDQSVGRKIISNNLNANGKDLIIITGANTGGKSTFMRSIGIAHLMMQAGMFVTAETFSAEVRKGIFTHFKREEDVAMESGKLDEELDRMSEIVDKLKHGSIVFFNESFSATNEIEGSEIATQITSALIESGIKVIFVTHQYEFANALYKKSLPNAIFLRAERLPDGKRTFNIIEGEPLQTSYGVDLYNAIFFNENALK